MARFSYTARVKNQQSQPPSAHLDVRAFARTGGSLSGKASLSLFDRVAQDCVDKGANVVVSWSANGQSRAADQGAPRLFLHVQMQAELPLTCQRCLDTVHFPVLVDQWFRFVADEVSAEQQDDDADEDLLVESDDFNLCELLEDELVLAVPLIATHTSCPDAPSVSAQDADFDTAADDKPSPFAALAKLKRGSGQSSS